MQNTVLHICLPAGIQTTDGALLAEPVTIDAVSSLSPFYSSVDQVRLTGGPGLRKMTEFTIAGQIYMTSKQADLMNYRPPVATFGIGPQDYPMWVQSRNQWVTALAAKELLLNASILMAPGTHTIANITVTKQKGYENEGLSGKLAELTRIVNINDITIRSGGAVAPGGHAYSLFSAKGVFDWQEKTPARTWLGSGAGANASSIDPGSSGGGRGKAVKVWSSPTTCLAMTNLRVGSYSVGMIIPTLASYNIGGPLGA